MKKLFVLLLIAVMSCTSFSACINAEPTIAETTAKTTTAETTTTTVTTTAQTTALTTTAETEPPETEPTTTASITTADNSSDTRSTQQKLDDIIVANPDVLIGYALYNADTNKYLYHYNDDMEINMSGEIPTYWLYLLMKKSKTEPKVSPYFGKEVYENSYVYNLFYKDGQMWFRLDDLINYYFYDGDLGAKAALETKIPLGYGKSIKVNGENIYVNSEKDTKNPTITENIAKWLFVNEFLNENSEESDFLKNLLSNNDRDSFFYEGTGVLVPHAGDEIEDLYYDDETVKTTKVTQFYDTGIIEADGTDYIFVIYTQNTDSADIVRDISRYFYEEVI
jgi:hypothetical protein